jgi:hypothetical protein
VSPFSLHSIQLNFAFRLMKRFSTTLSLCFVSISSILYHMKPSCVLTALHSNIPEWIWILKASELWRQTRKLRVSIFHLPYESERRGTGMSLPCFACMVLDRADGHCSLLFLSKVWHYTRLPIFPVQELKCINLSLNPSINIPQPSDMKFFHFLRTSPMQHLIEAYISLNWR